MRRLSSILLALTLASGCAAGADDFVPEDDAVFSAKADDSSKLRPAWPERRALAHEEPLRDQVLQYEKSTGVVRPGEEEGDIEIEWQRPEDAWTEFGRYAITIEEPSLVSVELSGRYVGSLSAAIYVQQPAAVTTDRVISDQTDRFEFEATVPGEYRVVIVPMIFSNLNQFRYTIEASIAPNSAL